MILALACAADLSIRAVAGIPEPDVILYGSVCVNGARQRSVQTDVVVEATVDVEGRPQVVGRYRMGDSPPAGDRYVLRIRRESGIDGSPQSADAARANQQVRVTIKNGPAASFTLDEPGAVRRLDLFVGDVGLDGDGDADLKDFAFLQRCFTGSAPGAPVPACAAVDKDHDGDVDLIDYLGVAGALAGPCQ